MREERKRNIISEAKEKGRELMENFNMLTLFDILLVIFGAYMLFSGQRMKNSGKISTLIVPESEIQKIGNKKDFIKEVYGKMMVFAGIIMLYGAFGILTDFVPNIPGAAMGNIIGVIIFFVAMVWFFRSLINAKKKYMY